MRRISFAYAPVASMWVVALHSLFFYSDLLLPCHPPSDWLWLFSSQTFSHKYSNFSQTQSFFIPTCLWRWNREIVLKHCHIKFRRCGITHKKVYKDSELQLKFRFIRCWQWYSTCKLTIIWQNIGIKTTTTFVAIGSTTVFIFIFIVHCTQHNVAKLELCN